MAGKAGTTEVTPCPLPLSPAQLATCQVITAQLADHRYLGLAALSVPSLVGLACAVKAISRRPKGKGLRLSLPLTGKRRATGRMHAAAASTKLIKFGKDGSRAPEVTKRTKHAAGEEWEVEFHPGDSAVHFSDPNSLEELASALDVHRVQVERLPEARRAVIHVIERDPLVNSEVSPLLQATTTNFREIQLGTDDRGRPVILNMVTERGCRNLLVAGVTGGGKSNVLHSVIAHAALDPTVDLWPFDPKGGAELGAWRPSSKVFVGNNLDHILEESLDRMNDLMKIIKSRFEEGAGHGVRTFRYDKDHRLMVVVIDELSELVGSNGERKRFADMLERCSKLARAVGIVMVAATQRPSADVVPTIIRVHYPYRLGLRMMDPDSSDCILGKGQAAKGYDASTIADANAGEGWLISDGAHPRRIRAFNFPDEALETIAARAAALRGAAKQLTPIQSEPEPASATPQLRVVAGSGLHTIPPPEPTPVLAIPDSQGNHPQPVPNEPPESNQPRFQWTERDVRILQRLAQGPLRRRAIEDEFFRSKQACSDVMDRLLKREVVTKTRDPFVKREIQYAIADAGRQVLSDRQAQGGDAA